MKDFTLMHLKVIAILSNSILPFYCLCLLFIFVQIRGTPPVLLNNIKCVGGSYRHAVIAYTDNTARSPYILIMGDKRLNLNSENQYKPMTQSLVHLLPSKNAVG